MCPGVTVAATSRRRLGWVVVGGASRQDRQDVGRARERSCGPCRGFARVGFRARLTLQVKFLAPARERVVGWGAWGQECTLDVVGVCVAVSSLKQLPAPQCLWSGSRELRRLQAPQGYGFCPLSMHACSYCRKHPSLRCGLPQDKG